MSNLSCKMFGFKQFNPLSSSKSINTPKLPFSQFMKNSVDFSFPSSLQPSPSSPSISPDKNIKEINSSKDVRLGIKDQDGKKVLFKIHWSYCEGGESNSRKQSFITITKYNDQD